MVERWIEINNKGKELEEIIDYLYAIGINEGDYMYERIMDNMIDAIKKKTNKLKTDQEKIYIKYMNI
jgi:hypothetical protein